LPGFADLALILILVLTIFIAGKLPQLVTSWSKALLSLREKRKHSETDSSQLNADD